MTFVRKVFTKAELSVRNPSKVLKTPKVCAACGHVKALKQASSEKPPQWTKFLAWSSHGEPKKGTQNEGWAHQKWLQNLNMFCIAFSDGKGT